MADAGIDPTARIDRVFHALSDHTRRDILRRTMTHPSTISRLAAEYTMSFSAVHKHVTVLERAGLVTKLSRGRERVVSADPAAVHQAAALLAEYEQLWRHRIARLDALLDDDRPS